MCLCVGGGGGGGVFGGGQVRAAFDPDKKRKNPRARKAEKLKKVKSKGVYAHMYMTEGKRVSSCME